MSATQLCVSTYSRRMLLQRTLGAITAATAVGASLRPASATIKISKAAVGYQDHPDGDKRCGKCVQFVAPDTCKMVDGPISPQGYCRIFAPLRQA
jgi:hypothetical protein